jgi:ABC-type Fe3+ transport system substrate-binding protein
METAKVTRRATIAGIVAAGCGGFNAAAVEPSVELDPSIIAAAKSEGQVVWYTTQIIDQFVRPAAAAFEAKYGIKVNYVRSDSNAVALRIFNEGQAGHVQADVFDGTAGVAPLKKKNLVMKWLPPSAAHLAPQYVDPEGYWAATNIYVLTPGYNTSLVALVDAPKTFDDLLDPKWKNKLTWNASPTMSGAGGFIGLIIKVMGEQKGRTYLRKLSQQNILALQLSARQVLDQVIAGEAAIALNIFNNHAVISAAQGAPVAWIPMQPAEAVFSVISLTRGAPHVNAGKLLINYIVSTEGQQLFRNANYIPADQNVPPLVPGLRPDGKNFKAAYFLPEQIEAGMPTWKNIYDEYFK